MKLRTLAVASVVALTVAGCGSSGSTKPGQPHQPQYSTPDPGFVRISSDGGIGSYDTVSLWCHVATDQVWVKSEVDHGGSFVPEPGATCPHPIGSHSGVGH